MRLVATREEEFSCSPAETPSPTGLKPASPRTDISPPEDDDVLGRGGLCHTR